MCIAYPAHVLSVHDDATATVDVLGHSQIVLLAVVDDAGTPVSSGDWLLVQTGLALARIDEVEATQRLALINRTGGGVT